MHIIVVSSRLANTKSLTLTKVHLVAGGLAVAAVIAGLVAALFYVSVRYAAEVRLPMVRSLVASVQAQQTRRSKQVLHENIDALAVKLGEMQAQLVRLDALGERLTSLAGIKESEFRFGEPLGRGGAVPAGSHMQSLSLQDLGQQVDALSRRLDDRADNLGMLQDRFFNARVKRNLLPTVMPVASKWSDSGFGWRIDPFTGKRAMHEGVDFAADVGTPIFAAASGVVITAGYRPDFGKMVEIDHGNGFVTRYAHASKLLVKSGQVVQRGSEIAEVGSTGRSTGPHLHFEVRYHGVALNPAKFLRASARYPAKFLRASTR